MSLPFEPRGGIDSFADRCIDRRSRGWTWRKISKDEGCALSTLYEYFDRHPDTRKKIEASAETETIENIRQTLTEVAIEKKDRQILIHLSKAKLKNYEQPVQEPVTVIANQVLAPSFSKEEAEKILAAMVDDVSKAK